MRTHILFALLMLSTPPASVAQADSAAKAFEATWMQPRTDGRLWHELPPPANIVNAGFAMEHSNAVRRDARWLRLAGAAMGAVLWTQNRAVGYAVGGAVLSYSVVLDFRSTRSGREAGRLLQLGYTVHERYDLVPDSLDDGLRERLIPQRFR